MAERRRPGGWLAAWDVLTAGAAPFARPILARRLARGKEDPARWEEKLGRASLPRPEGLLVWMHAVGVGEVMALRGLVAAMGRLDPALRFLLTSTSRTSAEALARNMPDRAVHQFLPLDVPAARRAFLDHWRPDLSVWAEQDLWPGLVAETARRGVPLALVNARMNDAAFRRRRRAAGLFRETLGLFGLVTAQDEETARNLSTLGAKDVRVTGSLKPAAPPLSDDPAAREALARVFGDRRVWVAASTHEEDEAVALAAHGRLRSSDARALLIVAPRNPHRGPEIAASCAGSDLPVALRSWDEMPGDETAVYVADTMGEMGLWYRLAPVALIGGGFGQTGGHSPWEAVRLGAAVLHGPNTSNFAGDYAALGAAGGALRVGTADDIVAALTAPGLDDRVRRARSLVAEAEARIDGLARDLARLMGRAGG